MKCKMIRSKHRASVKTGGKLSLREYVEGLSSDLRATFEEGKKNARQKGKKAPRVARKFVPVQQEKKKKKEQR